MRAETEAVVNDIKESLSLLRRHLDPDQAKARLSALDAEAEAPDFWNDAGRAQTLMRERQQIETSLNAFDRLANELDDNLTLVSMGEEEGDESIVAEAEAALQKLRAEAHTREVEALLSGEADANDAFIEIHAGAGGTESQDWAQMLERMYLRWSEARGYKTELIGEHYGDEAGIKSATILVKGLNAYGWLKTESGVHRLVRISPFDSNARRHTSFASVWIYPVIDENIDIEIDEKDVRIDTYRASGAGGQHVNTTDSAVRITHEPTGIVVQCQNQRSQHKNRATAWAMLRARLYEAELKRREEEALAAAASKSEIGWGHQIRSYVLQPYQLVKDLRTGVESTNPTAVLDGDIDAFIEAALAERIHADQKPENKPA
ncbi:peptide chain release factor 2 [Methyloceanibacter sp.]|uniref:peptide chain release factor 2 n=1 Tax=Methyloceanibacter sp. TaxID=1965321 RepID=UPI003569AC45